MAITELYVRADADGSGNGTTDANSGANGSFTWAQMLADTTAGPCRYNVKAGSYSRTTSNDTFTTAGTTALPRFIRGFNSTAGDLESNGRTLGSSLVTTNFPVITYTTGSLTVAAFMIAEHLDVTGAKAGITVSLGGNGSRARRCKFSNTNAASSPSAIACDTGAFASCVLSDSDINCTTTSTSATALSLSRGFATNCLCTCASGIAVASIGFGTLSNCMIRDSVTGISFTGTVIGAYACSFRNISGNYVSNAAANGAGSIENCVAWGSGGSSKWYNSATSVRAIMQQFNAVGNMGAADTNEGDWPIYSEVTITADPFTSSTVLTLNNTAGGGATCRSAGLFSYRDIGALQHQESAGGAIGGGNLSGGFQ